ncbi:TM2 domain-containing protein CG11103-like [Argonauta hians]
MAGRWIVLVSSVWVLLDFCLGHSLIDKECMNESCGATYKPYSPLILCSFLPMDFLNCSPPQDVEENETASERMGCTKWGGRRYEEVQKISVWCTALDGIECFGNRTFLKKGFPCVVYNGHYFLTTLIYSILLGFLGMDRFCLGHTGTAVGKLLTLGGIGIWWIVDIILLITGSLKPEDGSSWVPYF